MRVVQTPKRALRCYVPDEVLAVVLSAILHTVSGGNAGYGGSMDWRGVSGFQQRCWIRGGGGWLESMRPLVVGAVFAGTREEEDCFRCCVCPAFCGCDPC